MLCVNRPCLSNVCETVSKIRTCNDFFPRVMQHRIGNFYFREMAIKLTMWHHLNRCTRDWVPDNFHGLIVILGEEGNKRKPETISMWNTLDLWPKKLARIIFVPWVVYMYDMMTLSEKVQKLSLFRSPVHLTFHLISIGIIFITWIGLMCDTVTLWKK
jgi:hypothetical protein